MGDLIEITTWPKAHNSFYKITSNALTLEIKAAGNAAIGLSKEPINKCCDLWIIVGDGPRCWIKGADGRAQDMGVYAPNILSIEEYRKFWITWSQGHVRLSLYGHTTPLTSCSIHTDKINYITFSVLQQRNPVLWRFEVTPIIDSIKYIPIKEGRLHWVTYRLGQELPEDILVGGYEGEKIYIARATHRGSLTPGKFIPSKGKAYISWDGRAREKTEFEVLCGFDGIWVPTVEDRVPVGAFVGGYSEMGSERLYIGRTKCNEHLIPGKLHSIHKKLLFPYQGRELSCSHYEILVVPEQDQRCVNPFICLDGDVLGIEESDSSNNSDEERHVL